MADHEETQRLAEEALRKRGYRVKDTKIRRTVTYKDGMTPDLEAVKDDETLWIEVKGDNTDFVKQIEAYSTLLEGKTVLLLGIDTSNIELWGLQDLEGE